VPAERLSQLCRRLVWTFDATVSSFERKMYAHLPHDANKAMNLNAYIGLMGRKVRQIETRMGIVLRDSQDDDAMVIPDSDYLLTLDADSVLLREYCLRLVYHLELPGNERIAVAQTPYAAFRGADTRLERIAGATTDIQHIVHQGLTYYGATFWVGANAVIRKIALDDIVEVSFVGGQEVRRYVQDRTVIEDTESSIDLIASGWTLFNYPERLSYSATPPDFGSLVVQRARWANGGLLIAPKFLRLI
jgi:cellulose synthase (UDP-forming)